MLRWGGGLHLLQERGLAGLVHDIQHAVIAFLDRWEVSITPDTGSLPVPRRPLALTPSRPASRTVPAFHGLPAPPPPGGALHRDCMCYIQQSGETWKCTCILCVCVEPTSIRVSMTWSMKLAGRGKCGHVFFFPRIQMKRNKLALAVRLNA